MSNLKEHYKTIVIPKLIERDQEMFNLIQTPSSPLQQYIKYKLISNLDNNKSLSIKKTIYFECEIDLLHKFNKTWYNKIEWISNLMKNITPIRVS